MDENELNKILEERFGIKAIDATNSPAVLTSTLDKFLNRASDFEGVELEKPKFNDCLKYEILCSGVTNGVGESGSNFSIRAKNKYIILNFQ